MGQEVLAFRVSANLCALEAEASGTGEVARFVPSSSGQDFANSVPNDFEKESLRICNLPSLCVFSLDLYKNEVHAA